MMSLPAGRFVGWNASRCSGGTNGTTRNVSPPTVNVRSRLATPAWRSWSKSLGNSAPFVGLPVEGYHWLRSSVSAMLRQIGRSRLDRLGGGDGGGAASENQDDRGNGDSSPV